MRILAISQFFPYPPVNGGKMRAYQLIRGLSRLHPVHLLTFSSSREDMQHIAHLREICEEVHAVEQTPFNSLSLRGVAGFLSPAPRSYAASWNGEMRNLVARQMRRYHFDAAIAFGLRNAAYLADYNGLFRVIDNENCDSAFAARLAETAASPLAKFRRTMTWVKSRQYESKLASKFDAALVVSDDDKRALIDIAPSLAARDAVHVVPNGTDLSLLEYRGPEVDARRIISPGALTYSANYDAARYFCESIFPLVKARMPDTQLMITGGHEGVDTSSFEGHPDICLTGYLEDVRPAVAGSAVVVVPTRIGGGTRLKVLEAMALGTPVVATTFGAMGLGAVDGEHILIADSPQAFAEGVCSVMQDGELRSRLARDAREFVASRFGWDSIVGSLSRVLDAVSN